MANKGYDDTKELKAMAAGIKNGIYTSVEQAAKAVLADPRQSNVDRLRRKFREQDWHLQTARTPIRELPTPNGRECVEILKKRLRNPWKTIARMYSRDVRSDYPFITAMALLSSIPVILLVTDIPKDLIAHHTISGKLLLGIGVEAALATFIHLLCMLSLERFEGFPSIGVPSTVAAED